MVDDSRKSVDVAKDNYVDFQERITAAKQQLEVRQKPLIRAQGMVEALLNSTNASLYAWELRLSGIDAMLEAYSGGTEGFDVLCDLQATARNMKSSFRNNARSIQEKLDAFTAQTTEISNALTALESSRERLETSRQDNEARESLRLASSRLSTVERQTLDNFTPPQVDMTQARLAIASAEALIEIKESK